MEISTNQKLFLQTDHFSILLVLKDLPLKTENPVAARKIVRWNTNKPDGWKKYEEMAGNSDKLLDIAANTTATADVLMNNIDKELYPCESLCQNTGIGTLFGILVEDPLSTIDSLSQEDSV